jgi:hypothetical protein
MALGTLTQLASVRTAGVSSLGSGSVTPTAGALLLIVAAACVDGGNGNDLQFSLSNTLSLTQHTIGNVHRGNAGGNPGNFDHGTAAWWAVSTGSAVTFTVSTASTQYGRVGLRVYEITGQDTSTPIGGVFAGVTTPAQPAQNASCSVTLSSAPATDSLVLGILVPGCGSSTPGTPVPASGWTEIWDAPYDDWYAWQGQTRTGSTSTTVGWDSYYQTGQDDSYGDVSAIAFEINAASGGGGATSFIFRRPMATLSSHFR